MYHVTCIIGVIEVDEQSLNAMHLAIAHDYKIIMFRRFNKYRHMKLNKSFNQNVKYFHTKTLTLGGPHRNVDFYLT